MLKAKKLYFDLIFKESSNYNKFALKNFKMQNLSITQNLNQKLSPQQIQFMKLLQVSSSNIEGIIKKELEAIYKIVFSGGSGGVEGVIKKYSKDRGPD